MHIAQTGTVEHAGKQITTQPAGFLLNRFGLLSVLAILVLAAWSRQVVIVILLGLVLSTA